MFDNFILGVIVISSLKLVVDTYFDEEPSTYSAGSQQFLAFLDILDLLFNMIFILELSLKVISYGTRA